MKKAVSPLVAVILLIALTVAVTTLLATWNLRYTREIQESGESVLGEMDCVFDVELSIKNACISDNRLIATIENRGKEIKGFSYTISGAESYSNMSYNAIEAYAVAEQEFPFEGVSSPERAAIRPITRYGSVDVICKDKETRVINLAPC